MTINPAHLGIKQDFWLLPDDLSEDAPYFKAISKLQQLPQHETPTGKINCLVDSAKAIIESIKDYWKKKQKDTEKIEIGGDELLPLFTYILIKANTPNLCSESNFISTFISEQSSIEQGGYLLATLQTAMSFLVCLEQSDMEKSVKELLEAAIARHQKEDVPPIENTIDLPEIPFENLEALLADENLPNLNDQPPLSELPPPGEEYLVPSQNNHSEQTEKKNDLISFD